jgi:hypothetical protein
MSFSALSIASAKETEGLFSSQNNTVHTKNLRRGKKIQELKGEAALFRTLALYF